MWLMELRGRCSVWDSKALDRTEKIEPNNHMRDMCCVKITVPAKQELDNSRLGEPQQ